MSKSPNELPIIYWLFNFGDWNLGHCLVFGIWDLVLLHAVQVNPQLIKNQGQNRRIRACLSVLFFETKKVYTLFNLKSEMTRGFVP